MLISDPQACASLPLPSTVSPVKLLATGALLCLALGFVEAVMAVAGGWIPAGASVATPDAAGMLVGLSLLRGSTVAGMLLLAVFAQRWLSVPVRWRYSVALLLAVLLGTALAWAVYESMFCRFAGAFGYLERYRNCSGGTPMHNWTAVKVARHFQLAALVVGLVSFVAYSRHAAQARHQTQLRRMALERERAAVQAHLLQAQIEPHFLFNTLANLRWLLRTDSDAGLAMLGDMRRYVQESLPRLRGHTASLDTELELVRAYLDLHAVRMGPRLRYTIEVPEGLRQAAVPPMLLLTLVENGLKHGLQPLPEGGRIDITGQCEAGNLTLTVRDSGRGMGQAIGQGMGLSNLRARLRVLYGQGASLSLHLNEPRGLCVRVRWPMATS